MSHARMKTAFLYFSNYLPWSIFLIAVAVGKPGFHGISTFLVVNWHASDLFLIKQLGISSQQCSQNMGFRNFFNVLVTPKLHIKG